MIEKKCKSSPTTLEKEPVDQNRLNDFLINYRKQICNYLGWLPSLQIPTKQM